MQTARTVIASAAFRLVSTPPPAQPVRSKPRPPFSLRLSDAERARLERDAGDMPLGAYVRSRLFDEGTTRRPSIRRPLKDQQLLAKLLSELGQARLANNLNQLAYAANCGSLPVSPETEAALFAAYADIQAMRRDLMTALGLEADDRP